MSNLTYEQMKLPNYMNSNEAIKIGYKPRNGEWQEIGLTIPDVVFAAELAATNVLAIADTGRGKTQLFSDITWHHFGGDGQVGSTNWIDARPNFEISELLERTKVDRAADVYDSKDATRLDEERTLRPLFCVDEVNRTVQVKQADYFDIADGKYSFRGRRIRLGRSGYTLFLATANLNKVNGDFKGTYQFDRALLNRAHLTLDLDHPKFRPTADDQIEINQRSSDPRVVTSKPQDISDLIIAEHDDIVERAKAFDPYILGLQFLVDRGLDHCDKDRFKEKTMFPSLCHDCNYAGKEWCSLVKASSDRTLKTIKALSYGLARIVQLKLGENVEVDQLDAALQAFRFTTYHGNLNEVTIETDYGSRKQAFMDDVVAKLSEVADLFRAYVPKIKEAKSDVALLVYNLDNRECRSIGSQNLIKQLSEAAIPYQECTLKKELESKGFGTDWVDSYVEAIK